MQSTNCCVCGNLFQWTTNKPRMCCSVKCAAQLGGRARSNAPKRQPILANGEKWCPRCRSMLRVSLFHPSKHQASGYRSWCKQCESEEATANLYARNERQLERRREQQNHCCAVCGDGITPSTSDVDHDHATGRVRGVLCHQCNAGLGFFKDDASRLRAAAKYLEDGIPLGTSYRYVTVLP